MARDAIFLAGTVLIPATDWDRARLPAREECFVVLMETMLTMACCLHKTSIPRQGSLLEMRSQLMRR